MTEVTLPKATSAEDWGAPEWQMNDAYGDSPEDNRYQRAKANLLSDMESLRAVMELLHKMRLYTFGHLSILIAFCRVYCRYKPI